MKKFGGILFLLPLYVVAVGSASQNDYNDFPQIEPPGFSVSDQDTDTNRPMVEKIKLFLTYSAYGFSNKVAHLVEAGVPANATNSAGDTALTVLPRKIRPVLNKEEITGLAKYLIQHGAEVEAKDKKGKMAADYAAEYGWYELLPIVDVSGKYKSKYQDQKIVAAQNTLLGAVGDLTIESITSSGNFPTGSYAKVKIISDALKLGASPDQEVMLEALGGASSEDYWLPFGQIMPEAILDLIKAGARINEPLSNGLQPLFYAVSKPTLFKLLLDAGADPHKASFVTWTYLPPNYQQAGIKFKIVREPIICEAAEFGRAETLEMLLQAGISIEERDSEGNTPLHRAVTFANFETIDFLIKHHASLTVTNNAGQNALDLAAARANVDFVRTYDKAGRYHKILEDYPGNPKSPVVGRWALESAKTDLYLRFAPDGGGEVFYCSWRRPLAWKTNKDSIEVSVYFAQIPRMPGDELEPGWVEFDSKSDTCILRWRDQAQPSPVKLIRMK
jgi:ankyrin repeat protein